MTLLYRWIDERTLRSCLRTGRMRGRTTHFLPKAVSGLPHTRLVRGVSFSRLPRRWHLAQPVCWIVDAERIPNRLVDLNGQAVHGLTEYIRGAGAVTRRGTVDPLVRAKPGFDQWWRAVVHDSAESPDEVLVVGDLEGVLIDHTIDITVEQDAPERVRDAVGEALETMGLTAGGPVL